MRKKAIVTGASRGIGRGIIRELAAAGYDIAFSYRTREDEAKEAALARSGAGSVVRCELDRDDGSIRYEIEIRDGNKEIDVEVDAVTKEILHYEEEVID